MAPVVPIQAIFWNLSLTAILWQHRWLWVFNTMVYVQYNTVTFSPHIFLDVPLWVWKALSPLFFKFFQLLLPSQSRVQSYFRLFGWQLYSFAEEIWFLKPPYISPSGIRYCYRFLRIDKQMCLITSLLACSQSCLYYLWHSLMKFSVIQIAVSSAHPTTQ
jgi:hypothetical protein